MSNTELSHVEVAIIKRREYLESLFGEIQNGYKTPQEAIDLLQPHLKAVEVPQEIATKKPARTLWQCYESARNPPETAKDPIVLPWPKLNAYLGGGLHRGRFTVLGGSTGHGKSSLAINIAIAAASAGRPVKYFSLEMMGEEIAMRVLAHLTTIKESDLAVEGAFLSEREKDALDLGKLELKDLPITVDDSAEDSIDAILKEIEEDETSDLFILDHMHMATSGHENRILDLDKIAKNLRLLSLRKCVHILALAQLTRPRGSEQYMPSLQDMAWCKFINTYANQVLFIHDKNQNDDQIEIKLDKNRHGKPSPNLLFKWEGSICKLTEWSDLP